MVLSRKQRRPEDLKDKHGDSSSPKVRSFVVRLGVS